MRLSCQENLVPGKSLEEKLSNLEKYGFEGVEFQGKGIFEREEEIKKALSKSSIKASTICAGFSGCPLDSKREEREKAISDIKKLLEIASNIGAVGLIMVPVFGPPSIPDLSPYATDIELEKRLFVDILKEIGEWAISLNSLLLIEPLNRYETHFLNRLDQAIDICEKVNNPRIKIMADFFHMSIEERDVPTSLEKAGDWVLHIHLADSNRKLPGQGHTDFKGSFAALKKVGYDKYMALECGILGNPEEELPKCVKYLKEQM